MNLNNNQQLNPNISKDNKHEILNDMIKNEMRHSNNFKTGDEFHNQTNINAYLTRSQIDQLQEDGISVSESELAKLHQEVMKEEGVPLEESID